jgi:hypothetical protein
MIETLEEETYAAIDSLDDSKKTRSQACKLLVKISQAIDSNHESLKRSLGCNRASPSAYLELYHGIMRGNRLFELRDLLKKALDVAGITEERIAAARPKLPVRMTGDRYRRAPRKKTPQQMTFL